MLEVHQGSTSDLLARSVTPGSNPVTLICPSLPSSQVLDQVLIAASQNGRGLRVVTSLHGPGPPATMRQLEGLIRLGQVGVKVKATDRSTLPSMLLAPPDGCCLLPTDWGWGESRWQCPMIVGGREALHLFSLGEKIWRQAGAYYGARRLRIARRWLEEVAAEGFDADRESSAIRDEFELAELTLFDKRRGGRRAPGRRDRQAWWTFHGTAEERVNPFLPIRLWAAQRQTHRAIRFPEGRRPTGVRTDDYVFFVLHSRQPAGAPEAFIVGSARALAYRNLVDDASEEERAADSFLDRFPHALRVEDVRLVRGAVGEGLSANQIMDKLGAHLFESTDKNLARRSGNVDPRRSIAQKALIRLSDRGAEETAGLLDQRLRRLGCVTAAEISPKE
jgi:hypothetical protein